MSIKIITLLGLLFVTNCTFRATKVTVVGAGNVGATAANVLAINEVAAEVVLIDIKEGLAEGKAMDIMQTAQLVGFDTIVKGVTNDYSLTAASDVVVITSGVPRKPGMTREELLGVNAKIVKSVVENLIKFSPEAIFVVVANPMDAMTHLTLKLTGLPRNRVIGMGGLLDSSRFKYFLSQALQCNHNDVHGIVIGGHGDKTMIPLARFATYKGIPVSHLLPDEKIAEFNTTLNSLEDYLKTANLECYDLLLGRDTKTKVGILYMKNIVENDLIEKVKLKLSTIDIDGIIDSTYLKENLESKNNNFFPTIVSTERPDKVTMSLLEGKVVIIVDNSPYALIMPNYFIDFFHTVDDYYQKPINATFIRIVRLLAFFISIFVPALYIMVTTHNHNFINLDLLLSLKAQRESVPFKAITEALLMMLAFEILRESDIRMSSTSGNAVSILGGLILGDAAVSAGIISPIMIIVIAISAISGLTFSSIELVSAIRWWRLLLIILSAILGIWGIIIGGALLVIRLLTIKNFDRHYLTPIMPFIKTEFKDNIIKFSNKGIKYRNPTLTKNVKRGHFR